MDTDDTDIHVPRWLAQGLVPTTLILALGSGLLMWRDFAVMDSRLASLEPRIKSVEEFRIAGSRITAEDGERNRKQIREIDHRLDRLEKQFSLLGGYCGFGGEGKQ